MPDLGLINGGYTLDLMGNHQRLQLRTWASELASRSRSSSRGSPTSGTA